MAKKAKKSGSGSAKSEAEKKKLLSAKNPDQYIQRSLDSKLSRGEKGSLTREWLEKTGYTHEDILYARNRNPYWKKQKGRGSYERTLKRIKKLNFGGKSTGRKVWSDADLGRFYELNDKMADWQLAQKFKTSLPAVNHIRRKFKLAKALLEKQRKTVNKGAGVKLSRTDEKVLRTTLAGKR